ncbi:cobalt ABC transporter [Luteococcus sp. H138]|uniref:cobalt ABC transporter n=1 Tax=unclassified Luteococcus TaxID=2639923 RepID=UPI00313CA3A6
MVSADGGGLGLRVTGPLRRILVDGGSGAGKTSFARRLQAHWSELCSEQVQLVSLDDCYPGWDGLAVGSRMVVDDILHPTTPGYRRWDWERNRPADWVELDPGRPMVVEGCGALSVASAPLAGLGIWLELEHAERKRRALARDGNGYAPWWDRWAAQEAEHWRLNRPWLLATLVIRVAPEASQEALNPLKTMTTG